MSTPDLRELALQLPPDERVLLAQELLSSTTCGPSTAAQANGLVDQVVTITSQLFHCPVTVKESYDPEFPGEKYIVFVAETSAEPATILNLESQWNRQVTERFPGWHGFRLMVRRAK